MLTDFKKKLQVHFVKILTQGLMVTSQVFFFINLQCYEDDHSSKPCFTSCCSIVSAQSYLRNVCILTWESTLYQKLLNQYPWVKLVCFMNKIITKAKLFMFNSKLWSCMEVPQCWSKHWLAFRVFEKRDQISNIGIKGIPKGKEIPETIKPCPMK